jgi:DNA-binding SARP family transcriptional activator/TolB-like protein
MCYHGQAACKANGHLGNAVLQIDVLGPLLLRVDGREIKLPRKAQALLAYLALQRGNAVARERLAFLLWPDNSDEQARHGLRNCLFDIRRIVGASINRWLQADSHQLLLGGNDLDIDLINFETASRSRSITALSDAATLYRGEFLADLRVLAEPFADWLTHMREQVVATAAEVFRCLAEAAAVASDFPIAIATARRLVELDRLSEASHRTLIQIYAQAGQRSMALRQYKTCVDLLRRELGVEPEPETKALAKRLEGVLEQGVPNSDDRPGATAAAQQERSGPRIAGSAARDERPLSGPLEEALARSWFKAERLSVGVAPIRNLTNGVLRQQAVEGLTEDLISDLTGLGRGFTISRLRYNPIHRGEGVKASWSDVRYIIAGNVQCGVQTLRLSIMLIEALSGEYLWTGRYECERSQLVVMQTTITGQISRELHLHVIQEASRSLLARDAEQSAEELVSDGIFLLTRSTRPGPMPVREGQIHFLRALARDRRNPDALAGLGHCCFRLASHPYWLPTNAMLPAVIDLGRESVRAALTLNPQHAYGHCIDGMLSSVAGGLEHAQEALERAISIDPALMLAQPFAGYNAAFLGRANETAPAAQRAIKAHPNQPARGAWLFLAGTGETLLGRYEPARSLLEASLSVDGTAGTPRLWLAAARSLGGDEAGAMRVIGEFQERYPAYRLREFTQQFVNRSPHPTYRRQVDVVFQQLRGLGIPD